MKALRNIFSILLLFLGAAIVIGQGDDQRLRTVSSGMNHREKKIVNKGLDQIYVNEDTAEVHRTEINTVTSSVTAVEAELDSMTSYHMFIYFGDSAVSLSYTTSWAHLTNAGDSLFIQFELDGFTVSNDTITAVYGGHDSFSGIFTHDGDNGETISIRFYNVTQTEGIPVAGANTTRAANNFMSTPVNGYYDLIAGDKIVVQYKGDANGTAVFKNGSIYINRLHE